jgi:hypothetical protein
MRLTLLLGALSALLALPAGAFEFGPYKDVSLFADTADHRIASAVDGTRRQLPATELLPPGATLSWSFAIGECGRETWLGVEADAFARANVTAFAAAKTPYIVSTGGETGVFTCATDAGMTRFIKRYASPMLRGFDFDIEGKQTPAQVDALVRRVKAAQRQHPQLRWSFTLATWAASDAGGASLNPLGDSVLAAIKRHRLEGAVINLMVMNYGPASAANCVVREGRCDMAASALQAAHNLQRKHGVPYAQIALTAMLGVNNVAENVFTLADAQTLARGARALGLAGLHHWSLDRDRGCAPAGNELSPTCHSLEGLQPLQFTRALAAPVR